MAEESTQSNGRGVKAADKTCRILYSLMELDGAGVTELSSHLGLSKGTIHHHLQTLKKNELIKKRSDSTYELSYRLLEFGEFVRDQSHLLNIAQGPVDDLADEVNARAQIVEECFGKTACLHIAETERMIPSETTVGQHVNMHNTAAGKSILAYYPEQRVRDIVDRHGLPKRTENTLVTIDALLGELEEIRERGVAFNDEENMERLRAVGAPILRPDQKPVGSISISGTTQSFNDKRFFNELPEKVLNTCDIIGIRLQIT